MPRLPEGVFRRKDRPGLWVRDRRGGRDRWYRFETKAAAKDFRDELRAGRKAPSRITVGEAARRWLERSLPLTRNEKGVKLARQRVEADLGEHLGTVRLSRLTREDCRAYRASLEAREPRRSPQTVAHILADLRALLLWAVDADLIDRSPFPRRLLPRVQERVPDRLTDEEVERLVSLPGPDGFVLRLLLGTGLRWSEARRAQASDLERGHLVVSQTKSGRVRRVPVAPELEREIRSRVGRLVATVNADTLARRARSVVQKFHVHQTRHTFACRWLEAGGSITALQEVLGHASVTTTQRYGRPSESSVKREASRSWG